MSRFIVLTVLACLIFYGTCYKIVPEAFARIFPGTPPGKLVKLTTNVNSKKNVTLAKRALRDWHQYWDFPKELKPNDSVHHVNAYIAKGKVGLDFIDQRWSVKKFLNYIFRKATDSKYLTSEESEDIRTMYWEEDVKWQIGWKENFETTFDWVIFLADKKYKKTPPLEEKFEKLISEFAEEKSKDYSHLLWNLQ